MHVKELYPFGKENNNDPMFMPTRTKKVVMNDDDFDPWGKGFGNPAWDQQGNVQRYKFAPSAEEGIPDPPSSTNAREERNWRSRDTTNVDTKRVFGLNWRPIIISKAVTELGQRFRVKQCFMDPPFPYRRNFRHNRQKEKIEPC
ncbi:uncharacterized protein TNCV_4536082 [Trichonephila clavipes]|nr:uncharacterized protein TNCV_4536082 [Trichonephila clavipes]